MMENKWSVEEQARFLKRTGELLKRGYSLAEAIESLSHYLERKRWGDIQNSLFTLKEGYPLYMILNNLNFNKELVSYVYFAEQHGSLADAVLEGSEIVLKRDSDYKRIKKLASYPLFLVLLTGVLFFFIERILLPKFSSLFLDMKLNPNIFMKAINFTASLLPYLLTSIIIASLLMIAYYYWFFRKLTPFRQKLLLIKLPMAGKFIKLFNTHFYAAQLSYLLAGGLSILDAFKIFEQNGKDPFLMDIGRNTITKLAKGEPLELVIASYPFFEKELSRIIKHGQDNAKLDQELYFYSRHCLSQLEERTEKLMKIIQPLLFSFLGLLIVSLYLAILLPMFQLIQGV
jgi:competence protein ComGB